LVLAAVALAGDAVLDLAGGGELEALLDAALGLELGHFRPFCWSVRLKRPRQPWMAGPFVTADRSEKRAP